jgi:hypothetical protein
MIGLGDGTMSRIADDEYERSVRQTHSAETLLPSSYATLVICALLVSLLLFF